MPVQFLGIYREKRFSPGAHAAGDAEILELTQAALERAWLSHDTHRPRDFTDYASLRPGSLQHVPES